KRNGSCLCRVLLLRPGRMGMLLRGVWLKLLKFVMGQYVGYLKLLGRVVHCRRSSLIL
ncbi:Hypothetical predicted protein, partial [Prunus dulcis]